MTSPAEIVSDLLDTWAQNRERHLALAFDVVKVDSSVIDTWSGAKATRLQQLIKSEGCPAEVIDRILHDVERDTLADFEANGSLMFPRSIELLAIVAATGTTFNPEQQEDTLREIFCSPSGAPTRQAMQNFQQARWFHWPLYARVNMVRDHLEGILFLVNVRERAEDVETWDSLVGTWNGSIESLIEACSLVNR